MELVDQMSGSDFTNYFLAFPEEGKNLTLAEKKSTKLAREGVLELCHNVRYASLVPVADFAEFVGYDDAVGYRIRRFVQRISQWQR